MPFDMGELIVDEGSTVGDTSISPRVIRDLLNRPRGLNAATIVEYLNIRIAEINKMSREGGYVGVTTANAPIKFLVCCDCLRVLIDTIPAVVPEKDQGTSDIRFNKQLASFEKQAAQLVAQIEEKGGTAFHVKATAAKVSGTTSGQLSGSLNYE